MVYRRARRLVAYWRADAFVVHPYRRGSAFAVDPALAGFLHHCTAWRTAAELATVVGAGNTRRIQTLLNRLVTAGILERRAKPIEPVPTVWDKWGDAAAILHFSKRDP